MKARMRKDLSAERLIRAVESEFRRNRDDDTNPALQGNLRRLFRVHRRPSDETVWVESHSLRQLRHLLANRNERLINP